MCRVSGVYIGFRVQGRVQGSDNQHMAMASCQCLTLSVALPSVESVWAVQGHTQFENFSQQRVRFYHIRSSSSVWCFRRRKVIYSISWKEHHMMWPNHYTTLKPDRQENLYIPLKVLELRIYVYMTSHIHLTHLCTLRCVRTHEGTASGNPHMS